MIVCFFYLGKLISRQFLHGLVPFFVGKTHALFQVTQGDLLLFLNLTDQGLGRFAQLYLSFGLFGLHLGEEENFLDGSIVGPIDGLLEGWDDALEKTDKFPPGPGDALYYEGCPVFQRARQISLGWCNILASVLSQSDRAWGMKILLYMGRILSYLSLSIGDGTFERVDASTAFAKRTLHQINLILGELQEKTKTSPEYKSMFKLINDHLLETHDLVITYLNDCRKRKNGDFDK